MNLEIDYLWSHKCPKKWDQYTLIALVITIIVLLILAGVTIVTLTGDNGLLSKASNAKQTTTDAEIEEEIRLAWNSVYPDSYLNNYDLATKASELKKALDKNGSTSTVTPEGGKLKVNYKNKDFILDPTTGELDMKKPLPEVTAGQKATGSNAIYKSENYTAIIPEGFTVSNQPGESSIKEGLVIRDDSGNEFVWIPVGIPWKKSDPSKTIELARYEFKKATDSTAGTILQTKTDGSALTPSGYSTSYYTEEGTRETGTKNAVAKDINDFIAKTNATGGFWIGRYEARTTSQTARSSKTDPLTSVTEKPEYAVYNYITQPDASAKARTMYEENNYFESDLVNSYAWDTATLFLQEYDNRTYDINTNSNYKAKYSNQIRLSSGIKNTGTNNLSAEANKDKICNVYDMADNCWEWTTETYSNESSPCVIRGGSYDYGSYGYTSTRNYDDTTFAYGGYSFRPVLYIK